VTLRRPNPAPLRVRRHQASLSEASIPALSKWKRFNVVLMFDTSINAEKLVLEITLEAKKKSNSIKPEAIDVSRFSSVEVIGWNRECVRMLCRNSLDPPLQTPRSRCTQLDVRPLLDCP